jgi:hypothetical protein
VGESPELPQRRKWTLVESGQNVFVGVADKFSVVGIGGFLSRKRKFRLTKPVRDWVVSHDIGSERGRNIGMNWARLEPLAIQVGDNDASIHLLNCLSGQNSHPDPTGNDHISLMPSPPGAKNHRFTQAQGMSEFGENGVARSVAEDEMPP